MGGKELEKMNKKIHTFATIAVIATLMLSFTAVAVLPTLVTASESDMGSEIAYSSVGNDSKPSDEELQAAIQEEFSKLSAEYDSQMMAEYGITYAEYSAIMDYLSDKAIYLTVENGEPVAYFVESIDKGKTMTDSELRGDQLRIYIDTVSMSMLVSAGAGGFAAALGAIIGTVAIPIPGIGTISGAVLAGVIVGVAAAGLYQFVSEQYALDHGIWIDITVQGHFTVFGSKIYYPLPPALWSLAGYGAQ